METADALIAANKEDYGHDKEPVEHTNPLLSKFFYVESGGKKRARKQEERKEVEGTASIKKMKDLEETGLFAQGLGGASSGAKPESPELELLTKAVDTLRPELLIASFKGVDRSIVKLLNGCVWASSIGGPVLFPPGKIELTRNPLFALRTTITNIMSKLNGKIFKLSVNIFKLNGKIVFTLPPCQEVVWVSIGRS